MAQAAVNEESPKGQPPRYSISRIVDLPGGIEQAVFYRRRHAAQTLVRRVKRSDIEELVLLIFYFCVAATVPARHWGGICSFVSRLRLKKHMRKRFPAFQRDIVAILGADADAAGIFRDRRAAIHRRRLQVMGNIAGWHWKPRIIVEGAAEVERARARGHGAILWCDHFFSQTVMGKRAMWEAGIKVHQLSVHEHGFATSWFARTFTNWIMLAVEDRFLAGRLSFARADARSVTARIDDLLGRNGVVLIVNSAYAGTSFVELPIGVGGYARFATAPANFAARGKTALLGMSTVETLPFLEYRVVISPEPGLPAARAEGRTAKDLPRLAAIVRASRDRIEQNLRACPGQCQGIGNVYVRASIRDLSG